MLVGVIADDFTGASDIANTLAKGIGPRGGLTTAQFLGVPRGAAPETIEAGVIALKSRSIPAAAAVEQSVSALKWLKQQGCRQIVFKYCSTFDSGPAGNIGPVGEALAAELGVTGVVACPAFPATGRTVYQGHLFVNGRLLSESGMENHPLNPMTDPDIRRWLALQTTSAVGLVPWNIVRRGADAIGDALGDAGKNGQTLVIVDALSDDDLIAIGKAVADAPLVSGSSGIALALPANMIAKGLAHGATAPTCDVQGPEAILAGSCSTATREQISVHQKEHPVLAIDVGKVMNRTQGVEDIVAFVSANPGREPLVYSAASPDDVRQNQKTFGAELVARRLEELYAEAARALVANGIRRLVVAGGETSGAVAQALDLGPLTVGREIDPGVPALLSAGPRPIALALKSGNFGAPDFFTKAMKRLAGE